MRAPGAGVPPVSLRAEAQPADLRWPVPHPKPGAHSPYCRCGKNQRLAAGASGHLPRLLKPYVSTADRRCELEAEFAVDSPLEGDGFEPSVPHKKQPFLAAPGGYD